MSTTTDIEWTILISTMVLMSFLCFMILLLVLNTSRRHRHRAELAEADLRHHREVQDAEREATEQTLREVGRELHDNVGQLLTVAQWGMSAVLDDKEPLSRLEGARDALVQGIDEVRRLGHSLNSDLWLHRTLADAICAEAERMERVGRVKAHVLVSGTLPVLTADACTILFRVFQEVMNNAMKHSGADTLTIALEYGPPFTLTLADNGRGFDMEHTKGNGGLVNIRRRCALIGFTAHCTSAPGKGTSWTLQQHDNGRA